MINIISIPSNIILIEPLGYDRFWRYSRGINYIKKPCITLRHTSARWETMLIKANLLFPPDSKDILNKIIKLILQTMIDKNPYGDKVADKTISIIRKDHKIIIVI